MVPVVQHYWAQVFIVVCARWPIDHECASGAVGVLQGEVRVVPGGPVLACMPFVGEAVVGWEGACEFVSHYI